LIDPTRVEEGSTKVDEVVARLVEIAAEGHKALVFSQFTRLLAIVRARLDAAGVVYEYLDGATKHRERHVLRFQEDTACTAFLISLKAGGYGLNLTAADFVFMLDPWWNPAAEAQAIDRAHRIGRTRPVVAYRFVMEGTIEEKVVELQQHKRALADSILAADAGSSLELTSEDLADLLG
jgi:SNF2 family DNA or RNA helicase